MEQLLTKALAPVGSTMYVWGGGWNQSDDGAGSEAVSIGVSPRWADFASGCEPSYNYENTRYQSHDGLDCSGYLGWLIYNLFNDRPGNAGYVMKAAKMASAFAEYGWGSYTPASELVDWRPGDVMSMKSHAWLCLGSCCDGSVLLVHASPPGVGIAGTELPSGAGSQAVALAERVMSGYYPRWYAKFPRCAADSSYLTQSGQFRWNRATLSDSKGLTAMTAPDLVSVLFTGREVKI